MKLTIVIVNYNVKHYLSACLHSVQRALTGIPAEVIVVDNASTDGSVAELSLRFPEVRFIENAENCGFARANNQAIREAKGEYVLLLNPDTVVGEEVLDECVAFMDSHPSAGAVGVKMLKANGGFAWESRRGVPTPLTSFFKMVGLCNLFPKSRLFGKYYMRYLDENDIARIEIVSGAFMVLRRSALDEIGLLDETFFMYGEDIDLSYRLLKGGYQNYYLPCPIVHYKGESTQKTSFRYVRNFYNAMIIFYDKHFGSKHRWMSLLVRMGVCLMGALEFLVRQPKRLDRKADDGERYRLLLVGSPEVCGEMETICTRQGISFTTLELDMHDTEERTLPLGRISGYREQMKEAYTHIVFDMELFNYSDVMAFMQREHFRGGDSRMQMGLYLSSAATMVFASDCYKLEKNPD